MKLNRVAVKFPVRPETAEVDLEPFIPLFHEMIREKALPGLLLDVADYRHVPEGPGVIVIGHDVDYGIDMQGGRAGLLVVAKRCAEDDVAAAVRRILAWGLEAATAIGERSGVEFGADTLEVHALDRAAAPNTPAAAGALAGALAPVLGALYGGTAPEAERAHADDTRRPLALRVRAAGAPALAELAGRLAAEAEAAPSAPTGPAQSEWDVSVEQLVVLREGPATHQLIDVRELHEREICEIGGDLMPLGTLASRLAELDNGAHIVVYCRSGARSAKAVTAMREAGFENVWNLQGGILAWIDRIDPTLTRY